MTSLSENNDDQFLINTDYSQHGQRTQTVQATFSITKYHHMEWNLPNIMTIGNKLRYKIRRFFSYTLQLHSMAPAFFTKKVQDDCLNIKIDETTSAAVVWM